jgi:glutamate dehydrogenase
MLLRKEGIGLHHLLHPILSVERNDDGILSNIYLIHSDTSQTEAYQLFMVDALDDKQKHSLLGKLKLVLEDIVVATDDYQSLRIKCREARAYLTEILPYARTGAVPDTPEGLEEYIAFLDWLDEESYIFLGYREYKLIKEETAPEIQVIPDSGLGILRDVRKSKYFNPVPVESLQPEHRNRMNGPPLVLITKTNSESTVHRSSRMDCISIKELDKDGQFLKERRFLGLFTSKAIASPTKNIPILRRKLRQVLELERVRTGSHDFKQIVSVFDSIPRSELFWLDLKDLHRDIEEIMSIEQEEGVRVLRRFDPLHRGIALMVIMPKERFNSAVRQKIQDYLTEKLQASNLEYHLAMVEADDTQVRFHFFFSTNLSYDEIDFNLVDQEVIELTRTWEDRLESLLEQKLGKKRRPECDKVIRMLPEGYRAEVPVEEAIRDITNLIQMKQAKYRIDLHNPDRNRFPEKTSHLRIYHRQTLALNKVFPVLENLGFRIIEQISYTCTHSGKNSGPYAIDIFRVQDRAGRPIQIERDGERVEEALLQVLTGEIKNDRINHLVLNSGLRIRQAALLRTYRGYLFQVSAATSLTFITDTLLGNPSCAASLFRIFEAKFSPSGNGDRAAAVKQAKTQFLDCLESVSTLPEDEILRFLFRLIDSTVRTNFYLNKPYISIKIESRNLENIPEPRPYFEVFVESSNLEAIHLRGGKVARGGLRWSDRPDDFRTEILGLMKTQMTKNTLIVPVGSKGGFIVKDPPDDPSAMKEFVRDQYRTFIRGLLDLTDNIIDSKVIHPPGLVIHDDPDPYLVVAADKGTATFSDTANQISQEYDFWLGDAFASGGSYGYDHKKEAITAKGTWECVKRHFWEIGIDPHRDEFTAIGIGDMSGDVFGNGMLYSDKIRLLAAFNHRHIFIDPDPDASISYLERKRLFENPALSWQDYDPKKISKGGGVFSRQSKSISLSDEIKGLLEIRKDEISGLELVRRILQLEATLLWNGGVGTYVKASTERNSDVGDPNNNLVRIDASQLKVKIVGEGGNLGFTQLARIEYAEAGGRINTDAVDNSGGVDMSDHEVNIKILLQNEIRAASLDFTKRNSLLSQMTDEVAGLVLKNNYSQSLCLSLAEISSKQSPSAYASLQDFLVKSTQLNPEVEFLPDRSIRTQREKARKGYSRPELSILLAYTKMAIKRSFLDSPIPDEEVLQKYLNGYFPQVLRDTFLKSIEKHPLRREIVATQLTNLLVDQLGIDFIHSSIKETDAEPDEAIRAVLATYEILNLDPLFQELFKIEKEIRPSDFYEAIASVVESCRGIVEWILFTGRDTTNLTGYVNSYRNPLEDLRHKLGKLLPASSERKSYSRHKKVALRKGFPQRISAYLAAAAYLPSCMGVIDASRAADTSLEIAAKLYYQIGDKFHLGWIRDELGKIQIQNQWESIAVRGLIMDLRYAQTRLSVLYLKNRRSAKDKSLEDFFQQQARLLNKLEMSLQKIRTRQRLDMATGVVISRLLLQLMRSLESRTH